MDALFVYFSAIYQPITLADPISSHSLILINLAQIYTKFQPHCVESIFLASLCLFMAVCILYKSILMMLAKVASDFIGLKFHRLNFVMKITNFNVASWIISNLSCYPRIKIDRNSTFHGNGWKMVYMIDKSSRKCHRRLLCYDHRSTNV